MSAPPASTKVSFREAVRVWAKIGFLSFGGPAGQVALMHKELVEERRWIDEARFLHALNYCMLLPGPEAQQLATYVGWLLHRTPGGLVAGTLFVLPGALTILALSALYAGFREVPAVAAVFFGLKAAVLAVVVEAVLRIGRRALKSTLLRATAAAAFVGIFFLHVPFPLVVIGAGMSGYLAGRSFPGAFPAPAGLKASEGEPTVADAMAARGELEHTRPSVSRAFRVLAVCLVAWSAPFVLAFAAVGPRSVFLDEAWFFSKAAVVTFGGAYAVLAYIAQRAVSTYGWLHAGEMLDGLGLAETTPGPLILVTEFVGFLGAYRHPLGLSPLVAGALGAATTLWVTFVPCFLWIFLGAPYIEALRGSRALHHTLSAITAAVVGVILNLSIWFAVHVVFGTVTERTFGPLHVLVPELHSLDPVSATLAALALVAMLRFHVGLPKTLAASAALGAVYRLWVLPG